tara:strand:+ start:454 stop:756 length:303 start_codon:yes stop_codon:yes gene_type:complete
MTITDKIRQWGIDKGITAAGTTATVASQFNKTLEEVEELKMAILFQDFEETTDAIGDIAVTLILLSELRGVSFEECLQTAYNVISKRTGKIVDGVFVKDI